MTTALIRFEEKKESFFLAEPTEILFVHSADHYVRALIKQQGTTKWMTRHCTLKCLHQLLPQKEFVRLNKFYVLNRRYFSHIKESERKLFLTDGTIIPIPHRISRFIIENLASQ